MQASIHDRRTHLLLDDERKTLYHRRNACAACQAGYPDDVRFCGMCGRAVLRRQSGTILDDAYELGELLAESERAVVYRARDLATNTAVAVKVLRGRSTLRCAKPLLRLRDAHTAAIYDLGSTRDGRPYLVMEQLAGETLASRLTRGPLPWREALETLRAICCSLAEAHGHGVVHRHLEPQHVVLGETPKLIGYGVPDGVSAYTSPEQLVGAPGTCRSDIYALGVIAYEMLAGSRPFASAHAVLAARAPAPPADVPHDVAHLVLRCLQRDTMLRFASADDVIFEIDRLLTRSERRSFPGMTAFELEPARIVAEPPPPPAFVSGSTELDVRPVSFLRGSLVWFACFLAGGVGVGTAFARFV